VTAIFERMSTAAKPLGGEVIAREQAPDQLFAKGEVTRNRLVAEMAAIGALQGRLRSVHLSAHLETRAVLSSDQIARVSSPEATASQQRCRSTITITGRVHNSKITGCAELPQRQDYSAATVTGAARSERISRRA
jgi:hypothetical protein